MKLTTNLVSGLALIQGAVSEVGDPLLDMPTVLLPVIHLRGPIRDLTGFSATIDQQESFVNNRELGLAASSAAVTDLLCTFSRGLWHLALSVMGLANYTQPSGTTVDPEIRLQIVDPTGAAFDLVQIFAVNAVPQRVDRDFTVFFPRNSWALRLALRATGVGEAQMMQASVLASRLT